MKRRLHPVGLPTLLACAALLGFAPLLCSVGEASAVRAPKPLLAVVQLRCEGRENPLGVDVAAPRLSWRLQALHPTARGIRQNAYQILVATSAHALAKDQGELWNSGKVPSDETCAIVYAGQPLASSRRVFWKVRCRDAGHVWESGRAAAKAPGARYLRTESGCAVFETAAGRYTFTVAR